MDTDDRPYVLALVGSRRKRNTRALVESMRLALDAAGFDLAVESVHDYDIEPCVGCHRCVEGGACGLRDGAQALMARLSGAAGVVLASPVYMCGVAGSLKLFIDRTAAWFHRPVLVGKPAMALVTTAGSYQRETLAYLATVAMHWGLLYAGGATRDAGAMGRPLSRGETARFIRALAGGPKAFTPSLRQLALFQVQKVLALKILPVDGEFWRDRGWDRRSFYLDCRTPAWKALLASAFYRLLHARIKGFDADE